MSEPHDTFRQLVENALIGIEYKTDLARACMKQHLGDRVSDELIRHANDISQSAIRIISLAVAMKEEGL